MTTHLKLPSFPILKKSFFPALPCGLGMNKHLCSGFNPQLKSGREGLSLFGTALTKPLFGWCTILPLLAPNGHLIPPESLELHISCFPSFLPIRDLHLHAFHNLAIFHRLQLVVPHSAYYEILQLLISPLLKWHSMHSPEQKTICTAYICTRVLDMCLNCEL